MSFSKISYNLTMPELPEVETVCIGLVSKLEDTVIAKVVLRRLTLRWPIPQDIEQLLTGKQILKVRRRAKYLLIDIAGGSVVIHLGMSGCLQVVTRDAIVGKHDHVDIILTNGQILRYSDPRRFGCILWQPLGETHVRLCNLGIEPLSCDFNGEYLFRYSRNRKIFIKTLLMDQRVVVGIGNIYATEALFQAGIAPNLEAGQVFYLRYVKLTQVIKDILIKAISCGGTTFRSFIRLDGQPGHFRQHLSVYGRNGKPCLKCGHTLENLKIGNRSTVWCGLCQS